MNHLAAVLGFIGRLYAIRCAADYSLDTWPRNQCDRELWLANFRVFRLAALGTER